MKRLTFLLEIERDRLNEIFTYTNEQLDSICDAEIEAMYSTISTLFGFDLEISERSIEILKKLRARGRKLREIELEKKKNAHVTEVFADCGCYIFSSVLMSTSTGSSCVNCYDRMSV